MYLVQRTDLPTDWNDDNSEDSSKDVPPCAFTVAGSTGNIYHVTLDAIPSCTCPDFLRKRDLCKHVFFVLLKCIGIEQDSPLLYQKAFLASERRQLLRRMEQRRTGGTAVQAPAAVRAAYRQLTGVDATKYGIDEHENDSNDGGVQRKSLDADADCPICFDSLSTDAGNTALVYCRAACGANFHAECIQRWMVQGSHKDCPNCRQPWIDPHNNNNTSPDSRKRSREGYLNISDVTGQSPVRDTSTYHDARRRRYH